MCGCFTLKAPPAKLITRFVLDKCTDSSPRYIIPPSTDILLIRQSPEGKRVQHQLSCFLVPHWAKDESMSAKLNNARGESLADKPSFRDAFKRRRCPIPADGFYKWKTEGKNKQPYYISLKSGEPMAMAGLPALSTLACQPKTEWSFQSGGTIKFGAFYVPISFRFRSDSCSAFAPLSPAYCASCSISFVFNVVFKINKLSHCRVLCALLCALLSALFMTAINA